MRSRDITTAGGLTETEVETAAHIFAMLRTASDAQLESLDKAIRDALRGEPFIEWRRDDNPAYIAGLDFILVVQNELTRRRVALDALDAELNGGHLVLVGPGNDLNTYAAICDPKPHSDTLCWTGPDRSTVEEAMEDGREHHPGYEPRISGVLG